MACLKISYVFCLVALTGFIDFTETTTTSTTTTSTTTTTTTTTTTLPPTTTTTTTTTTLPPTATTTTTTPPPTTTTSSTTTSSTTTSGTTMSTTMADNGVKADWHGNPRCAHSNYSTERVPVPEQRGFRCYNEPESRMSDILSLWQIILMSGMSVVCSRMFQ